MYTCDVMRQYSDSNRHIPASSFGILPNRIREIFQICTRLHDFAEVEYDLYSDSAKSCKCVHIPNIAIIGFGDIRNELAGICLFESEYWPLHYMYTAESEYDEEKRNRT